jgi:hypothetical protein
LAQDDYWSYFNAVADSIPEDIESVSEPKILEYLQKWKDSVWTENDQSPKQKIGNIRQVPRPRFTRTTKWMMDRVKDAVDSYVCGRWLASISLCGTIAEIVSIHLLESHFRARGIEEARGIDLLTTMIKSLNQLARLNMLKKVGVLTKDERKKLDSIRTIRNNHMHQLTNAPEIKSDCHQALKDLVEFLNNHPIP